MIKAKIASVSTSHDMIRLSFNNANVGDMVISEQYYKTIGSPTVNADVVISIGVVETEK